VLWALKFEKSISMAALDAMAHSLVKSAGLRLRVVGIK